MLNTLHCTHAFPHSVIYFSVDWTKDPESMRIICGYAVLHYRGVGYDLRRPMAKFSWTCKTKPNRNPSTQASYNQRKNLIISPSLVKIHFPVLIRALFS